MTLPYETPTIRKLTPTEVDAMRGQGADFNRAPRLDPLNAPWFEKLIRWTRINSVLPHRWQFKFGD